MLPRQRHSPFVPRMMWILSPALILACTSVDVFVPGITISGSGRRNRTVFMKSQASQSQEQGGALRSPLLVVQLSFPYAVLESSPGFISEQHREAASKEAKATLPWLSISPNPTRTTGDSIAGPLTSASLPTACQAHAPCTPAGKVLRVQGNHSKAERVYQWL